MLTMHSFDRVVRRHEQEALLQHPSAWEPFCRAERQASRALRQDRARRATSSTPRLLRWSDSVQNESTAGIRTSMSIGVPARSTGISDLPALTITPAPYDPAGSVAVSGEKSPVSELLRTPDRYHSALLSPHTSPTDDGRSSPSIWAESLATPSSEVHIIRHISVSSSTYDW